MAVERVYLKNDEKNLHSVLHLSFALGIFLLKKNAFSHPLAHALPSPSPHPSSRRRQLQYFRRRPLTKMLIRHDIILLYDPPADFCSTSVFNTHTHTHKSESHTHNNIHLLPNFHCSRAPPLLYTIIIAFFGGDWGGVVEGVLLQAFRYYYYFFLS